MKPRTTLRALNCFIFGITCRSRSPLCPCRRSGKARSSRPPPPSRATPSTKSTRSRSLFPRFGGGTRSPNVPRSVQASRRFLWGPPAGLWALARARRRPWQPVVPSGASGNQVLKLQRKTYKLFAYPAASPVATGNIPTFAAATLSRFVFFTRYIASSAKCSNPSFVFESTG